MRSLFFLLIILALIVGLGMIIAPYFISSDVFKQKITEQLNQTTGYNVTISGKIRIQAFPTLAAQMDDITIHDIADSGSLPVMKIKSITANIALMPLLRKEVIVNSLTLESPEITLKTTSDGRINWKPPTTASPEQASQQPVTATAPVMQHLLLHDAFIRQGAFIYNNEKTNQYWEIKDITLDASLTNASVLTLAGTGEWKAKPVKITLEMETLEQLLAGQGVKIKAELKNDLLTLDTAGLWGNDAYIGKLNAKLPSLKDFVLWLQPSEKPPVQLMPLIFSIGGDVHCSASYCNLTQGALTLDEMKASGSISAAWGGPVPQLAADLSTDELDLNFFLPAEKLRVSSLMPLSAAIADDSEGWSDNPFDLASLQAMDADVKIRAGKILVRNIAVENTTLATKLQRGHLSASVTEADFYSGKASINIEAESIGKMLTLDQRWLIKDVQLGPLLKDALDDDRLSGTAEIKINMESTGKSPLELVSGLSGDGHFKIANGAFKGFNIAEMARNIQAAFKPTTELKESRTDFTELAGTFTINQGVVHNSDLAMKSPFLRLTGKGQINLPLNTLEYRLLPQLVDTAQGQGGKDKLAMVSAPIIVDGPLSDPSFRPDIRGMAHDAIQNPDKYKQQLKDTKGAIKDLLKKL